VPSYSLKVLEKYIGFQRSQEEFGGDWAIAKYIEATERHDPKERNAAMKHLLTYNREDLQAMWMILQWLQRLSLPVH
jgi:predicted RecB family nuclease